MKNKNKIWAVLVSVVLGFSGGLGIYTASVEGAGATASWQLISNMATARDQFAGGAAGDKIYVFGGNGNPDQINLKSGEVYDINAATWSAIADNNHNDQEGVEELCGVGLNDKFYVFGAWGGFGTGGYYGVINFNEMYDPMSDSWTTLAEKPTTTASGTPAVYDGKIYLFGGYYSDESMNDPILYDTVEAYDPDTNTWQYVTDMPRLLMSPAVAVYGDSAYIIGGYDANANAMNTEVMFYNFVSDTWTRNYCVAPSAAARAYTYASIIPVVEGKAYLVGGAEGTAINSWASNKFTTFDITAKAWENQAVLPNARDSHVVVFHDQTLYVIGGYANENNLNRGQSTVYAYEIPVVAKYQLTATVVGGHGTVLPDGGSYDAGTVVNLNATADDGYWVKSWQGTDDDTLTESGNTVTMDGDKSVTVEFETIPVDMPAISSLTVKAGKTRDSQSDSLMLKGNIHPEYFSLITDPANDLTDISLGVFSDDGSQEYGLIVQLDPADIVTDSKVSKISYVTPKGQAGPMLIFKVSLVNGAFTLTSKNLDLTGFQSPVMVELSIGSYHGSAMVYDGEDGSLDLINGAKTMPMQFMQGYADTLRVDKCSFTVGSKPQSDKLTIQGSLAVGDTGLDLDNEDVTIQWGTYSVALPAADIYQNGTKQVFKYKKPKGSDSSVAGALFDLEKGTFMITITKADIGVQANPVDFGLQFGSFNETAAIDLVQKNASTSVYP